MSYRIAFICAIVFTIVPSLFGVEHTVMDSDTLFGLSLEYRVSMHLIRRVNNLPDEHIQTGTVLHIPVEGITEIIVQKGDTLSELALLFDIPLQELITANNLNDDKLSVGEILHVPPATPSGMHRVTAGDTLLGIATRYDISMPQLMAYNMLKDETIHPNQLLTIEPPRVEGHRVQHGDSLWSIANSYGITLNDLSIWNNRDASGVIHPGEILSLYPDLSPTIIGESPTKSSGKTALARVQTEKPTLPLLPKDGEYYFSSPKYIQQPTLTYWEGANASSSEDYQRAQKVLEILRKETRSLDSLSTQMKGWTVVLDPGHGGLDPGAMVSVKDGNNNALFITEDEYAYDVSLRVFRTLLRHGAEVALTIMAPDHHIREGIDARTTFVNRKNEVYAHAEHNQNAGWRPVGSIEGLDLRKDIAAKKIQSVSKQKSYKGNIFISIHADNSPDLPAGTALLFDGADDDELNRSLELAEAFAPYMGKEAFSRRQRLRILQDNPADAAVLIEVRNIHYSRNAWALRSSELREQDAQKIVNGILAWSNR